MSKRSNTHPYTNAARAGRTTPGMVETITPGDPRYYPGRNSWNRPPEPRTPNRADRRAELRRVGALGGAARNRARRHAIRLQQKTAPGGDLFAAIRQLAAKIADSVKGAIR